MDIPVTQSVYIQKSQTITPKLQVESNGSPRDSHTAKNMEKTLEARLFTEKKRALFNINTQNARHIGLANPQPEFLATPERSPPKREELRIVDTMARSARATKLLKSSVVEQTIDDVMLMKKSVAGRDTSPFRMSPGRDRPQLK
jgi:hypothetical protein